MIDHAHELQTRANLDAIDITDVVSGLTSEAGDGMVLVSTTHTTVGLVVGPGDDAMLRDFIQLSKRWPALHGPFEHFEEHNPNSEAHLLSAFAGTSLTFRLSHGQVALGKYQRIIFLEFDGPRPRKFSVHVLEDPT